MKTYTVERKITIENKLAVVFSMPSLKAVQSTMDFFQHRYYTFTKTMMTLIAQWPTQGTGVRRSFIAFVIVINITQIAPLMAAFVKYRDDPKILLDCFIAILFIAFSLTKLICFVSNSKTTLQLVNRIRSDWRIWARDPEVDILHEYTELGKRTIVLYTGMMYSSLFVFMSEPVIPKIIDVLLMNGTEPGRFPFPVEYNYFNAQKYYFYIIMYSFIYTCVMCTVLIASDVMLIVYVQHCCGIFAALGHKLERIGNNAISGKTGEISQTEKGDIMQLGLCIDRHNDAIEYANLIEAIYSWTFFVLIGLGMILNIVIGLQILQRRSDPKSTIRLVIYALASLVLFSIMSYLSQMLLDHSDGIRFCVHNTKWYRLSPKAQKLLQLMTMRCSVPCRLTVGKFFIMGVRTFGLTIRTTLSYFTILRSMQQV